MRRKTLLLTDEVIVTQFRLSPVLDNGCRLAQWPDLTLMFVPDAPTPDELRAAYRDGAMLRELTIATALVSAPIGGRA